MDTKLREEAAVKSQRIRRLLSKPETLKKVRCFHAICRVSTCTCTCTRTRTFCIYVYVVLLYT